MLVIDGHILRSWRNALLVRDNKFIKNQLNVTFELKSCEFHLFFRILQIFSICAAKLCFVWQSNLVIKRWQYRPKGGKVAAMN